MFVGICWPCYQNNSLFNHWDILTSSELLRSKAKSFFYVIDASRPNIWGKKSVVMSVYNSEKYYTTHIVFRDKNS